MNITITDNAAKKIVALKNKENKEGLMLRLTVLGGGCSGFQYDIELDDKRTADDIVFEKNGAVVVTDPVSLPYLQNAELDFVQTMMNSAFKIRNPNAAASCGCGNSFAPKTN